MVLSLPARYDSNRNSFRWLCSSLLLTFLAGPFTQLFASEAPDPTPSLLAITNVNLITMEREQVLTQQSVLVENGVIKAIWPASDLAVPESALRIDGQQKFLMPGLCDMHVHLAPGTGVDNDPASRQLKLFLIHGVTTVRGMIGMPDHVELRDRVERGDVLGPTIKCAGPPMIGGPMPMPEKAAEFVVQQSMQGYDFIKVHEGLSPESYQAITSEAARRQIPVAGHVTATVGLKRALAAKQTSIEHLDGYLRESVVSTDPIQIPKGQFLFGPALDHIQEEKLLEWARATKEAGVWNTPTLHLFEMIVGGHNPAQLAAREEMKYVPAEQLGHFTKQLESASKIPAPPAERQKFVDWRRRLVRSFDSVGAEILVGSDSPQFFLVEGAATHHEIKSLVDAGLTPYKAIHAATRAPAEYLKAVGKPQLDAGTISVGKRADIVLLEKNPFDDINNLRSIAGVMVRGRWLSKEALTQMQNELIAMAKKAA